MSESSLKKSPYQEICYDDHELTKRLDELELLVTKRIIQLVIDTDVANDNAVKAKEDKDTDNDQYKSRIIEPEEHESFHNVKKFVIGLIGMTFVKAKKGKKPGNILKDANESNIELNQYSTSFVEDLDGILMVMERNGEEVVLNQLGEGVRRIIKTTIIGIRNSIEAQLPQELPHNVEPQDKPARNKKKKR